MEKAMHGALEEYGRTIKREGWKAGEPLIRKGLRKWKDFDRWARALAMMLRTQELLEEELQSKDRP